MSSASAPKLRFDWAVLRLVPRVHREEFANIGVLLHVPTEKLLLHRLLDEGAIEQRWARLSDGLDNLHSDRVKAVQEQICAITAVCEGAVTRGPVAGLSSTERFHWLTAPRSAVLQTSPVRVGLTENPALALERLFIEQCE